MKKSFFAVLQKLGQALMIPVSVLPAAGLLVALGRLLQRGAEQDPQAHFMKTAGQICFNGGLAIFQQLPVVFAVGVAIGFTGAAGVAGLAAVVAYFTLANVLKVMTTALALDLNIDTGVFGGILIGLMVAFLYNRYQNIKLHPVFGFFSGKRFVPIVSTASAIVLGLLLTFVWPPIQLQINHFGAWVMDSTFGPAFYAAGKRLLIPLGLHHVYYPPFLYQFGEFATQAGQVVKGETARYFAGDPSAGKFMAAEFPLMLFGLPAAALAIVLRAEKSRRRAILGMMLAAALTSIITGITEPIEFSFIFVAPPLYVFHVMAAFVSGYLTQLFDIHLGYTFSASLIDYGLGFFNQKNSFWLFAVVGPSIALLYFSVFYVTIPLFNFKTPGRETDKEEAPQATPIRGVAKDRAAKILVALGGAENILELEACITRLRLRLKDVAKIQGDTLKKLGASGLFNPGSGNVQVVFGVESDMIKEEIKALMAKPAHIVRSPLQGKLMSLSEVPDPTFSGEVLGPGFAILPTAGHMESPVNGVVQFVAPTLHAVGLLADNGAELLIHVGIDTVKLNGEGFKSFVKVGDTVTLGQRLLEFDLDLIEKNGKSTLTPVVLLNNQQFTMKEKATANSRLAFGEAVMTLNEMST